MDVNSSEHPPKKKSHSLKQIPIRVAKLALEQQIPVNSCEFQNNETQSTAQVANNIKIIRVERCLTSIGSDLVMEVEFSVCNKRVTLLVDTGAHACIIAAKHIKSNVLYYPKIKYCLVGINGPNSPIKTLGATYGNIVVCGVGLNHQFQIAGEDIHLEYDGIVGNDFLLKFGAIIDTYDKKISFILPSNHEVYENKTRMEFENENRNLISIHKSAEEMKYTECKVCVDDTKQQKNERNLIGKINSLQILRINTINNDKAISIAPESSIELLAEAKSDVVCKEKSFADGVFSINSVFSKGMNAIRVYNTSSKAIELPAEKLSVEFDELKEYDVYAFTNKKALKGRERINFILENLQTSHCSYEEKQIIKKLIAEYSDIFYVDGDDLSLAKFVEHQILLKPGTNPVFTRQYKLPHMHREILDRKIEEMLANGVIEPSTSLWNSPLLLVPKRDGKDNKDFRVCVDFRKINNVTENQTFPMPDLDEELSKMNGAKVFSTLDIYSAFHQINLRECDREITAFQTSNKKYQYTRMPFGLKASPITWQRFIIAALGDLLNKGNMAYMDDIMSYNVNTPTHVSNLTAVFDCLRKFNLKLKIDKTKLFCKEIRYLGHVISAEGVQSDPRNIAVIEKFPRPKKIEEIKRFLGMASYYRKYISNFAKIAQPMNALLKKNANFVWSDRCENSFTQLKKALMSKPILCFPDHGKTFYISVDASFYAVGAHISNNKPPNDRPIEYFSKSLNAAQINYATTHKELLAIVLAIERFRHYIWGRHFVVYTDHEALTYLFNQNKPGSRLLRWKLLLSEFDFDIIHRPGKSNVVSDCLSRIQLPNENELTPVRYFHYVKNPITKSILEIITRSRAKENAILKSNEPINAHEYHINEAKGVAFGAKKFNKIFFVFEDMKNSTFKRLELQLKKKIVFDGNAFYRLIELGEAFVMILIPKVQFDMKKMQYVLNDILKLVRAQANMNEIAINFCISNVSTYFEIKIEYRKMFKGCDTSTTFFLNDKIEVNDITHINEIMRTYHKSILGGHRGFERMKNTIRQFYSWPTMNSDIRKFIDSCGVCERTKVHKYTHTPLQITSVANAPFEKIYVDFVGEIRPNSEQNHKYLLTISCDLSKYLLAVPTFDSTAITAARAIVENVCLTFNIPRIIISDNGPAFIAETFKQMAKLLNITHIKTTPYHPQSNGGIERYHRTLGDYVRAYTEENRETWHRYIPFFLFSYNNTVHSTTGFSPHSLIFGYDIELPTTLSNSRPNYNYETYQQELQLQLKNAQRRAKKMIEDRKAENKRRYDDSKKCRNLKLKKNDLVLILNEKLPSHDKFEAKYRGPYRVEEVISESVTKIRIGKKSKNIHNDKLKLAKAKYEEVPPEI